MHIPLPPMSRVEGSKDYRFKLFSVVWGVFLFLHFIVYRTQFGAEIYWSTYLTLIIAAFLLVTRSYLVFYISLCISLIDALYQMPTFSNHTILKNFVLLVFLISSFVVCITKSKKEHIWTLARPGAGLLLCVMYVFGVLHKINSDFLFSNESCAVSLWAEMPKVFGFFYGDFFYRFIAFSTLIIEFLILVLLFTDRFRDWGVFIGAAFHGFLAISGYAFYPTFSTLTIALHILFLSQAASKVMLSRASINFMSFLLSKLLFVSWIAAIFTLCVVGDYGGAGMVWFAGFILFMYDLFLSVKSAKYVGNFSETNVEERSTPSSFLVNVVVVAFFINCMMPYLGLKTAQSMNMFANLRLEGGETNHYIFSSDWQYFNYLKDVVLLDSVSNDVYLSKKLNEGKNVIYYDLLNRLERNRSAIVSFSLDGQHYSSVSYGDLEGDSDRILHPRWFRGWFHFNSVDLSVPKKCALDS